MIIQIDKNLKIVLLKALKAGYLDTSKIPEIDNSWPQIVFFPTPLSEKDMEDIKRIERGGV